MNSFDVAIIGGGIIGSSVAYFLAKDSSFSGSAVIIEDDLTFSGSSTSRAVGGIRQQFSVPENIRMSEFGARFVKEAPLLLEREGFRPDIRFNEKGYLLLAPASGVKVLRDNHRVQTLLGARVRLMDRAEVHERFPWLDVSEIECGSLGLENEGWVDQVLLHRSLLAKAQSLGTTVRHGRVDGIEVRGGRLTRIRLADGSSISCGYAVNAAGARAAALASMAEITPFPVEPRKRIVYAFDAPPLGEGTPLVVDTTGVWFRPSGVSSYICGVSPSEHLDPPCDDLEVTEALFDSVVRPVLEKRVTVFRELLIRDAWAGHYEYNTFDQNAILGPHPRILNFLFANGFSGHGFQQAPAVGRAIAELIAYGRYQTLDLSRFSYNRILDNSPVVESNVI